MTFSYDAGSSSPTYAGLAEITNLRFNDGTFKSQHIPPITDSAPIRDVTGSLPQDHGGFVGTRFYDPWPFDLEGWLYVTSSPNDVQAAIDYLRGKFSLKAGLLTLTLNSRGWAASRQMSVYLNGPIIVEEPEVLLKKVPTRNVTVPLVAPDPRLYSTGSANTATISTGGGTAANNAGTADTPFSVTFNGPQTGPVVLTAPDGTKISVDTIASGHSVTVNTRDPSTGTPTAVTDTGANALASVNELSALVIPPGSASWVKSNGGGAGSTVMSWRDAWA